MADSALANMLKLKPNQRAALINAPDNYSTELRPMPAGVELNEGLIGKFAWIQIFLTSSAELKVLLPRVKKALEPEGIIWISYPKGGAKIPTDLNRDRLLPILLDSGLKVITLVAVDDTWSAFSARLYKKDEPRQTKPGAGRKR